MCARTSLRAAAVAEFMTLNREGSFPPSLRACIGVGVAIPTAVGKVELNLTQVLRHRPEDAV